MMQDENVTALFKGNAIFMMRADRDVQARHLIFSDACLCKDEGKIIAVKFKAISKLSHQRDMSLLL